MCSSVEAARASHGHGIALSWIKARAARPGKLFAWKESPMAMVEKPNWQTAAELLSRAIHGQMARLEVASPSLGGQIAVEWAPLRGVAYDPKDDLFEIQLEGVDHLVSHPQQFAIREIGGRADSFAVVGDDGAEHILQLREPILLPSTAGSV